jgi:import inner membrane translocase subunit TIM13
MAQITDQQRADFYRKQEESVGQQLFQQMVQTTKNRCFKTCVTRPGAALSKDEQKCLINCVDRFFEARAIVMHSYNKVYQSMMQQEGGSDEF